MIRNLQLFNPFRYNDNDSVQRQYACFLMKSYPLNESISILENKHAVGMISYNEWSLVRDIIVWSLTII